MSSTREYDVIVYGATGYTGRLVAEYMAKQYGVEGDVKWAMAGRSRQKLEQVRDEIGAPKNTPLVVADANDPASMKAMVESAKVICTTVGPYQLYGEPLVKACAEAGTGYVDLCGEPAWMRKMIDTYEAKAKQTGARIVFSCGFDSIPFDLGVFFVQEEAKKRFGAAAPRVKGRVRAMEGKFSGGTAASFKATMAAAGKDPMVVESMRNPFVLTPGFTGPEQPLGMSPMEDPATGGWVAPFIMAAINTRNVHRSNFLMGHPYGKDFVYDEMVITGPGEAGKQAAKALSSVNPLGGKVPQPGEGPTKEERESGHYNVLFIAEAKDGRTVKAGVTGDKDPGYASTSKMIAESAICLAKNEGVKAGGVYTPAPAFGMPLVERLCKNAGLTFKIEG